MVIPWAGRYPNSGWAFPLVNGSTLDGAGEYGASVFQVPRSGTLAAVWFMFGPITTGTAAGNDCALSLETVSSGLPSGSLYGGSSASALSFTTSEASKGRRVELSASLTVDDVVALVWRNPTGGTQPNWALRQQHYAAILPYRVENTGTPAKVAFGPHLLVLEYSDGWVWSLAYPPFAQATTYVATANASQRAGIQLDLPHAARVTGFFCTVDMDYAPCTIQLETVTGAILASATFASTDNRAVTYHGTWVATCAPVWVPAGRYYLMLTVNGSSVAFYASELYNPNTNAAQLEALVQQMSGGVGYVATGGSAPYTVSSAYVSHMLSVVYDAIDVPVPIRTRPMKRG